RSAGRGTSRSWSTPSTTCRCGCSAPPRRRCGPGQSAATSSPDRRWPPPASPRCCPCEGPFQDPSPRPPPRGGEGEEESPCWRCGFAPLLPLLPLSASGRGQGEGFHLVVLNLNLRTAHARNLRQHRRRDRRADPGAALDAELRLGGVPGGQD